MKGKFIVFEGSDGSGKTTILEGVKKFLEESDIDYIVTREPGGTKIGEEIRDILLQNYEGHEINYRTEALLFAAGRAQSVEEVLKPALQTKDIVISDRYILSSLAYQGYARNLGVEDVRAFNLFATDNLKPDYTFFLDVDPIKVLERKRSAVESDRLEKEPDEYHQKVYEGYKKILKSEENCIIIDASKPVDEVLKDTIEELKIILEV